MGHLYSITNGRGQTGSCSYDDAGRLINYSDPDGSISYTYDANGNILTITDSSGTISREYDALNRVTRYADVQGNSTSYTYDQVGNLLSLTYPDGKIVSYEYDANNQLKKVTDWAGRTTSYNYDANRRLSETTRADGSVESRSYDTAGNLTGISDTSGTLTSCEVTYDPVGNITNEKTNLPSQSYTMNDISMTYDSDNRLLTFNGNTVTYDADGNMTSGPLNGQIVSYAYDSRNRLQSVGDTSYTYDAENNRTGITQNGAETKYTVNPNAALSQVLIRTASDGTKTYYVYGLGLIGQEVSGEYRNYHYDLRGSTVSLTDQSGTVTDSFRYGPYGELLSKEGTSNPAFLYDGRDGVITDNNGLYYMRARYYSPEILRFINRDVLTGSISDSQSLNRYAYVNGQPMNYVDPFGLEGYMNWQNLGRTFKQTGQYLASSEAKQAYWNTLGAVLGAHVATLTMAEGAAAVVDTALIGKGAYNAVNKGAGNLGKTITTPYESAVTQETTQAALRVQQKVANGGKVFRDGEFGRSGAVEGQFWAPESPFNPGYADRYGVDFSKVDFVIGGSIKEGAPFVTRGAPGLGVNQGGAIEVVTNPNSVMLDFFYMP